MKLIIGKSQNTRTGKKLYVQQHRKSQNTRTGNKNYEDLTT